MAYICRLCTFIGSSINDLCRHLRISHSFYEGSQLKLQCSFPNCPSIFTTYSGFRKHLAKCKFNFETICTTKNPNNLTEIEPHVIAHDADEDLSITNTNTNNELNINTNNLSTNTFVSSNFSDTDNNDFSDSLLMFIRNLYSSGIPDLTIDKILQCVFQLVSPVFEKLLENVDTSNFICWQIASTFLNSFEQYFTKYKRQKIYDQHIVRPVEKSCGVRLDQRFDSKLRIFKMVPITCTFTYVPIIDTLKFLFTNSSFKKIMFDSIKEKAVTFSKYCDFRDGEIYKTNQLFQNSEKLTIAI